MEQSSQAGVGPLERRVRHHCYDCEAAIGKRHKYGCDVERCPDCGGQYISCDCGPKLLHKRLPWDGHLPGAQECREFGWYARRVPGLGWIACAATDPGASENLNRLVTDARWDAGAGRFVRPNVVLRGAREEDD